VWAIECGPSPRFGATGKERRSPFCPIFPLKGINEFSVFVRTRAIKLGPPRFFDLRMDSRGKLIGRGRMSHLAAVRSFPKMGAHKQAI